VKVSVKPIEVSETDMQPIDPEFIVAEVSKNWGPDSPPPTSQTCICGLFEKVIEHNRQRGYKLHSFQLHRLLTAPEHMNETIVAVFQKVTPAHRRRRTRPQRSLPRRVGPLPHPAGQHAHLRRAGPGSRVHRRGLRSG
jgi:hypothetical protein